MEEDKTVPVGEGAGVKVEGVRVEGGFVEGGVVEGGLVEGGFVQTGVPALELLLPGLPDGAIGRMPAGVGTNTPSEFFT